MRQAVNQPINFFTMNTQKIVRIAQKTREGYTILNLPGGKVDERGNGGRIPAVFVGESAEQDARAGCLLLTAEGVWGNIGLLIAQKGRHETFVPVPAKDRLEELAELVFALDPEYYGTVQAALANVDTNALTAADLANLEWTASQIANGDRDKRAEYHEALAERAREFLNNHKAQQAALKKWEDDARAAIESRNS
jgi:hypothetical protein